MTETRAPYEGAGHVLTIACLARLPEWTHEAPIFAVMHPADREQIALMIFSAGVDWAADMLHLMAERQKAGTP